jgi:hypothetical protein
VIKPAIGELLSGVAASLRERVLPEIPPGTTRRQIQAAIGIIARVALVWDKTGPYLYADNEDIVETLARMLPVLERVAIHDGTPRIGAVCAKLLKTLKPSSQPTQPYPSAEELGARNLELQEVLAEIQEALHENSHETRAKNSREAQGDDSHVAPREAALHGNSQETQRKNSADASADRDQLKPVATTDRDQLRSVASPDLNELKSMMLALFRRMLTRELEITRPPRRL